MTSDNAETANEPQDEPEGDEDESLEETRIMVEICHRVVQITAVVIALSATDVAKEVINGLG